MITIGNRVLIENFPQLQIPKGEKSQIDLDVYGWKLRITVEFSDDAPAQAIQVRPTSDGVRLVFEKWNNAIGVALREPARLAKLATGGYLEFLAANYRIGDMNLFSLQLLHNKEEK